MISLLNCWLLSSGLLQFGVAMAESEAEHESAMPCKEKKNLFPFIFYVIGGLRVPSVGERVPSADVIVPRRKKIFLHTLLSSLDLCSGREL